MSAPVEKAISSPELHSQVESFMERAGKILAHPLASSKVQMSFNTEIDPETEKFISIGFDHKNLPEESWTHLALIERPIVFTETDPTSIPILTSRIGREHLSLGVMLRTFRQSFVAWKKHVYMGARSFPQGSEPEVPMSWKPEGEPPTADGWITSLWVGEAETFPEGVDQIDFTGDWYFANIFFNACLWHSDDDKVAVWQEAGPMMRAHIMKCAEVRAIGGAGLVRSLHQFIVDARADGHQI